MHEYSSNKIYRKIVITIITVISLGINAAIAPLSNKLIDLMAKYLYAEFYPFILLFGIGFSSIFALLYYVFNILLWKIIPVIKQQNISGEYRCEGASSYNNSIWKGTVTIKQTWSRILIRLTAETSSSKSYMANIICCDDGVLELNYCYNNTPNGKIEELHKHEGTANLIFNGDEIGGKYYNYPNDRPRHGTMKLVKINRQKNIKGDKYEF